MNLSRRILTGVMSALTLAAPMTSAFSPAVAADETEEEQQFCAPISEVVQDSGLDIDYARALQYSLYFYDANMCGDQAQEHSLLDWRGDCHTYDAHVPLQPMYEIKTNNDGSEYKVLRNGTNLTQEFMDKYKDILDPDGDGGIDVCGGFHDAGDHVEFGMPENYTATTLGWGYYEYRDVYEKLGLNEHIETILRHFNDYLMKCTFRDASGKVIAHCYQVGDGGTDHSIWNCPEVDTMVRPAFFLTAEKPQIDYLALACSSLCINYFNFKDTDEEYAEKSLDYAKSIWAFIQDAVEACDGVYIENDEEGNPVQKLLSINADGPVSFYKSDHWEDDYCWAAAWMYMTTEDASAFEHTYALFDYYAPSGWCYCWNDMWSGAALMWAVINEEHPELDLVQKIRDAQGKNQYVFDNFWDDDCVGKCLKTWQGKETPGGMAWLNEWGSCRYNTAMQMICLLYDKYKNKGQATEWSAWAQKQMDYILGKNDITFKEEEKYSVLAGKNGTHGPRSFIVGYNDTSVKNPHHRAASGLLMAEDPREQKHILWGALAGGPDNNDGHDDATKDWTENEVTIDYNACLPAAAAGLYKLYGTDDMKLTPNFPPKDEKRVFGLGGKDGGSGYWIEALGLDNRNADGTGAVEVTMKVMSGEATPSKNIAVRYFINTSEISDLSVVETRILYDQSEKEVEGAKASISGLQKYKDSDDIYYVEVTWEGCNIVNSGKKNQFSVGFYGKGYTDPNTNKWVVYSWEPENDWSFEHLKIGVKSDFFAVDNPPEERCDYICVYADGVLVGGIEPDGSTPAKDEPSSEKETGSKNSGVLWGDANCDDEVNMADAVFIMQCISNPDKYKLTAKGEKNADVDDSGDVTNKDALKIQKFKLGIITTLHA